MSYAAKVPPCSLLKGMAEFHGYSVVRPVGVGGAGEVWLVRHSMLQTDFAVKVISKAVLDADAELRDQFSVEAKISGMVRHPSLVSVYDAGLDDSTGLYFLVMDYMPGGTVASRLSRERRFPLRKAASFVRNVAAGLVELKRLGIVHRDIKPLNMLIAADGSARLSDFGIALFAGSAQSQPRTNENVVVGTPLYMPPEQVSDSASVDCRADIYALGVSFYEMLAGVCPDAKLTSDDLLNKRLSGERLPDIRTVSAAIPEDVAQLISRMTDTEADKRPAAEEVVEALDSVLAVGRGGATVQKPPQSWGRRIVVASVVAFVAFMIYAIIMIPSWLADSLAAERKDSERNEQPVAEEPTESPMQPETFQGNVVTQMLETVREVVKTVVVTAVQEVATAPLADDEPDDELDFSDIAGDGDDTAPSEEPAVMPEPEQDQESGTGNLHPLFRKVCGIKITCDLAFEPDLDVLMAKIIAADEAVRHYRPCAKNEMVQSAVRSITIVADCDNPDGYVFNRGKASLTIGRKVLLSKDELDDLVSKFMTSWRDSVVEPFDRYLYEYIRLSVWSKISSDSWYNPARRKIRTSIDFARRIDTTYGPSDYNGQIKKYGVRKQFIEPQNKAVRYGRGKVFWLLHELEEFDDLTIRHYFEAKERAFKAHQISRKMTVHDCAVLFSNASGVDVVALLKRERWGIDTFATKVKLRSGLNKDILFGFRDSK